MNASICCSAFFIFELLSIMFSASSLNFTKNFI
jgi:hypothetical protein